MSQNFVVAFGGTGARCLEALTYLAASRAISAPMHLLLVDPDETNGNVATTRHQLRRYHAVQQKVASSDGEAAFFSTPLNAGMGPESFFWSNPQPNQPFQSLLHYSAHSGEERALLDLLYDESDLAMTFEKGYVGRAHIGSLDLLRTLKQQIESSVSPGEGEHPSSGSLQRFFRAVREATQRPGGARLLVIGSVFGGTGASGLPAIPPLMREVLLSGLQRELSLGCVQLTPYFSFPPGREEDPDSALHPLATQAALYHYSLADAGYDRVYLLGAPDRPHANNSNVPGGDAQRNRCHYAELGAALAAAHFFAQPPNGSAEVVACGSTEVSWDSLPARSQTAIRKNLVSFTTFCLMHSQYMSKALSEGRHTRTKWHDDLLRAGHTLGGQEPELGELTHFSVRYLDWIRELQQGSGIDLFTLGAPTSPDALAAVTDGGGMRDPYHHLFENLNRLGAGKQATGAGWYVHGLTRSSDAFCRNNYTRWWG